MEEVRVTQSRCFCRSVLVRRDPCERKGILFRSVLNACDNEFS
jgi:hypothetical protein